MRIIADLHTHTDACPHGHSPRYQYIEYAKSRGLYAVGISEHCQGYPDGVPMSYFEDMENWPRVVDGLRLLRGVEIDINDYRGRVYMQRRYMKHLDYVIASTHRSSLLPCDALTATRMWCGVAELPFVDVIGHPCREHDLWPYEVDTVVRAFRDHGKTVEINASSFGKPLHLETCRKIMECCGKYEVPIIVGSDSHYAVGTGRFDPAIRVLEEVGIPETQVVNASLPRLLAWLDAHSYDHSAK